MRSQLPFLGRTLTAHWPGEGPASENPPGASDRLPSAREPSAKESPACGQLESQSQSQSQPPRSLPPGFRRSGAAVCS